MYHTNHQMRMDKTAVVLNNGQVPLVKSRFMEYVNHEENPYGENAIVAIMCYTGYNVEDAVLINEGALQRGLFRTTYYTTYEAHEESTKVGNTMTDKHFANIETLPVVYGQKPGYDYSHLDQHGLIKENTPVTEKSILIGLTSNSAIDKDARVDMSVKPKKGQLGMVDKTFITEGEEGERIAKVRIRDIRIPNLGDKMASRSGQKGTVGMIIRECDMPFTADGIRPDIIINPHAIPTRMTIGQLVECITGKACVKLGAFGDCTAFNNKGSKIGVFGELLPKVGFHSSGNDVLYNGMTGEQIEMEIFMGPTYYMRLKHMVKDKINFRATGPRTALTRQPVAGRANDGGLRIGEMERDVLISHGISDFCRESMMKRGDEYAMAVCNQSGLIAIYNASKNVFVSPMVDGPLVYKETADGKEMVLNTMSQFGRSFSIVSVPYSLKLLIQELQAMNIHLRIITDQNIHQIESMTNSNNLEKLTHGDIVSYDALKKHIYKLRVGPSGDKIAETPALVSEKDTKRGTLSRTKDDERVLATKSIAYTTPDYGEEGSPVYRPGEDASWKTVSTAEKEESANTPITTTPTPTPTPTPTNNPTNSIASFFGLETGETSSNQKMAGGGNEFNSQSDYLGGRGPKHEHSPSHHVGDQVCYVKSGQYGLHPHHLWTVRKVGGRFYTIETELPSETMGDSIQVVEPYEIYRPSPEMDNGWNQYPVSDGQMMMDNNGVPVLAQPFPMDGMPLGETPKINIAPVIKIINGPDHSTNTGETGAAAGAGAGANTLVNGTPVVQTVSTGSNNAHTLPSKIKMNGGGGGNSNNSNGGNETSNGGGGNNKESGKSLLGNIIDFSKGLFIKKVGA